jgi:hypothetical protein
LVFGYTSTFSGNQTIAIGPHNKFDFPGGEPQCSGQNCGQPTTFSSGTHSSAFTLDNVISGTYKWFINGTNEKVICPKDLAMTCPSSLPVTFAGISATWDKQKTIKVEWSTASEKNNKEFQVIIVEPCHSLSQYTYVIEPSKSDGGNSSSMLNYSKDIPVSKGGDYLISVKQIDYDGRSESTKWVSVRIGYAK